MILKQKTIALYLQRVSDKGPKALLLAFIPFLFIEIVVATTSNSMLSRLYPYSHPNEHFGMRFRAKSLQLKEQKKSIVLLGASDIRDGINVKLLDSILKSEGFEEHTINMGTGGADIVDMYFQLDLVLPQKPKVIVVMSQWFSYYEYYQAAKMSHYASRLSTVIEIAQLVGKENFGIDPRSEIYQAPGGRSS